ncbi:agenet and bromo-adjacent homology (BAH) domain-containing protein [Wolffia australiana]
MGMNGRDFVEWREHFVSQERGSRVVHFFLEDSSGDSCLAAVGTERSLRHMLYVVAEEFLQEAGIEKSAASNLKWRSRREVVDWLKTFLPKQTCVRDASSSPITGPLDGINDLEPCLNKNMDRSTRHLRSYCSDIFWLGMPWTCSKQLKHYKAFCRNGTTIATHAFVIVMSEGEDNHYLAYLEDMYEDKKGQKKVRVRWFHQNQEVVGIVPPPAPHPQEVFITPYTQVISAECLDDLATILNPKHYDKCLANLPYACSAGIYLCYRQYSKNKFRPFDLSSLHGYFDQSILACLEICLSDEHEEPLRRVRPSLTWSTIQDERFGPSKRNGLSVKMMQPSSCCVPPFKADEKVELLCQDSGIRGCWFRGTVLKLSERRLKVRYDDLTIEDGFGNLEEWVPIYRRATPCKLEWRRVGRLMIRPRPLLDDASKSMKYEMGSAVDAWRNDGWWEGLVVGDDGPANILKVYFPGEDKILDCLRSDVRVSKDWVMDGWVDIEAKPLALPVLPSPIISSSEDAQASSLPSLTRASELGSSDISDQEASAAVAAADCDRNIPAADVTKVYARKRRRDEDSIKQETDNEKGRGEDGQEDDIGKIGC